MKLADNPVTLDDSLEDGRLQGFSHDGTLVVDMVFQPVFKYLVGDKDTEVCEWRVSPAHARRIAAWQMQDYACKGGVQ
jgi:hypothetical protein